MKSPLAPSTDLFGFDRAGIAGLHGIAVTFLVALGLALVLTPVARWLARLAGAIDMPEARRVHSVPTPRWGGLGVVCAGAFSLLVSAAILAGARAELVRSARMTAALAGGVLILLAVGLLDDRKSIRASVKLAVEVVAATLAVLAGCHVHSLFGFNLGSLSIPVTIVWIVAVINAFNMVDGLDGLAAGLAVIISSSLVVLSLQGSEGAMALIMAGLGGASLGFLFYNFNPASVFLGDSGSLPIGFLMAVASAETSGKGTTAASILVGALALGVPLTELSLTILRRLLRAVDVVRNSATNGEYRLRLAGRAALFTADRDHIHHRLLALGLRQRDATLLMYALCVVVNAGALLLAGRQGSYGSVLLIAAASVFIGCIHILGYRELQPVRNGMLLALFPARLLQRRWLQLCTDFSIALASMTGAWEVHPGNWPDIGLLGIVAATQTGVLALGGLYRRAQPFASVQGAVVIARSIFYAGCATWLVLAFVRPFPSSAAVILDLYLFASLIIGYRVSFYFLDHIFNRSRQADRRVVIYGTGDSATAALHTILGSPFLGMTVVGFVEERPAGRACHEGLPVLGFETFNNAARQFEEIIIPGAVPEKTLRQLSARCRLAKLSLKQLSVNCTEVGYPPEGRELIEPGEVQPGAS